MPWGDRCRGRSACARSIPAASPWCAACSTSYCRTFPARSSTSAATRPSTWGRAAARRRANERGTERVYLDYLLEIYREVTERGHTMQFWGDIIVQRPELIAELPKDSVALEWGYEADHPFDEHCREVRGLGHPVLRLPRHLGLVLARRAAPTTPSATC